MKPSPDKAKAKPPFRWVYVWVSQAHGVIELKGPRWTFGWVHNPDKPASRLRRMGLPPHVAIPFEQFLAAMAKSGFYVRSVEVHRVGVADKIEAKVKEFHARRGVDWG